MVYKIRVTEAEGKTFSGTDKPPITSVALPIKCANDTELGDRNICDGGKTIGCKKLAVVELFFTDLYDR
jgi:hypothetical protein